MRWDVLAATIVVILTFIATLWLVRDEAVTFTVIYVVGAAILLILAYIETLDDA